MKAVFYAWQSQLPNRTNRSFIEDCLERAIAEINRRRPSDPLFLDQDTRDVSGMPDVGQVIFDKIDTCAVFVPDLSICLRAHDRASPNANVLLELGYALRAIGDRRIVGVFNEATGSREELPFDLRRHRWPASYSLAEGADAEAKRGARDALVATLVERILAAAARADGDWEVDEAKNETSIFASAEPHGRFRNGEAIAYVDKAIPGVDASGQVVWRSAPQATIELRPKDGKETASFVELRKRAVSARFTLQAFGPRGAQWYSQNAFGFIAGDIVSSPTQPHAICVTQLYRNDGMLYGVNQAVVENRLEGHSISAEKVRSEFEATLANYLQFCRANPDFGDSWSLYITFQNVRGLWLRTQVDGIAKLHGPLAENFLYHGADSISLDADVTLAVRPLLEKLWDCAGIPYGE